MIKYLLILLSSLCFAQQTKYVDFKTVFGKINIDPAEKTVYGEVIYDFEILKSIDTIKIDAQNMSFSDLKINGKTIQYIATSKTLQLLYPFKKGKNKLTFKYKAIPKQTLYFIGDFTNTQNKLDGNSKNDFDGQIWTQGQGKYTSHWFPSFDDVNEKVIFNLEIAFDKKHQVIANGKLKSKKIVNDIALWNFEMQKPMSSYLLMLAIGNFEKQVQKSNTRVPLEFYLQPKDSAKFEPTYRHSKAIFDFLEKEIGVPYPWEIYKQIPVRDFLYAGMENTSATLFSQDFVVDTTGFNDRNYINVNAHELAHQWFGNLITAKSGKDHWLQEGFATYYALLAEEALFGENHFNWKMYEMAERLQQNSKTDSIPILNEKASSLTFYQKGAWALHILRTAVGKEKFQKAVKMYLEKHKFKNVETNNFLAEINAVSTFDTNNFKKRWLENGGFEVQEALELLKKNSFIKSYFEVAEMKNIPFLQKKKAFEKILSSKAFYPIKEEIIFQLQDVPFDEKSAVLNLAMQTNDLKVRQAIAQNTTQIPLDFKAEYETLLNDSSYITQEIAMSVLWSKFPENQISLLEKTKNWVGFNDKNLRILWLTLALKTENFQQNNKVIFYQELLGYSAADFESTTRQNALTNLIYLDKNDENYLPFLVNGLVNHKWQMIKFSKLAIRNFLKDKIHRAYFDALLPKIPKNEQLELQKILKE